jgi:hypothetical protein
MLVEIIKPFGPSIVKAKLTSEIVEKLNSYIDEVINDNTLSKSLDYGKNLVGNVKQEIELDIEFMKKIKWGEFLGSICKQWVEKELKKNLKDFRVINSWVVRQFKNEYNPIHWHGGDISGVGYLMVPQELGKTFQENKTLNRNGDIELIDGSRKLFSNSTYVITPSVGDLYLFPSYMMHTVYPFFDSTEERRSISFNAFIDKQTLQLK